MTINDKFDGVEFGKKLRKLRLHKELKIRQLETLSGVSNAYLSQLENGKRGKPSPEILRKIAGPLEVDYSDLMKIAGYIEEDADKKIVELLQKENIVDIIEFAYSILIDSISENGEVKKKYRNMILKDLKEEYSSFFNDEKLREPATWRVIFDALSFREKLDVVNMLKDDIGEIKIDNVRYKESDFNPIDNKANIPILGYIAAGQPIMIQEQIVGYEIFPEKVEGEHFVLIVRGDSMIGSRIYSGDKVLVKVQPEVENGEIAVVNVNGDDATLKKVKKYEDGSVWLVSTNEKYAPIPLNENSRVIGKVVRVIFEP